MAAVTATTTTTSTHASLWQCINLSAVMFFLTVANVGQARKNVAHGKGVLEGWVLASRLFCAIFPHQQPFLMGGLEAEKCPPATGSNAVVQLGDTVTSVTE
ncbi:hypothetical protein ZHAS_00015962 [Anopheles sinensis]|uniref:Uncharacterized protein n=1 Tax=Anopheles sinensis TaxID=74873 RepID=A0A084WCG0_ANOSI|nr:hypothetical protein ZHAS_00015962 [Anopheles sinensis]